MHSCRLEKFWKIPSIMFSLTRGYIVMGVCAFILLAFLTLGHPKFSRFSIVNQIYALDDEAATYIKLQQPAKVWDKSMAKENKHKQGCEIGYWKMKKKAEKNLKNGHFQQLYTDYFNLTKDFYNGKKLLDTGCGPRGSLEWADNAAVRICADPLADQYMDLGAREQKMLYTTAGVEALPFPNATFDVVTSINSFDHVTGYKKGIGEFARVVKPGGHFLMIVEIHAKPTVCEPVSLTWDLSKEFEAVGFRVILETHHETGGKYCRTIGTFSAGECGPFDHKDEKVRDGFLKVFMEKNTLK